MISVEQHLARIRSVMTPIATETVATASASGRVLRASVLSDIDLPPWPNSAMDGYAVHVDDLASAREDQPVTLPVRGEIAAGDTTAHSLAPGTTMRIMTGAAVPAGCTAVVPLEKTLGWDDTAPTAGAPLPEQVSFTEKAVAGAHIRTAGEDVQRGDTVVETGTPLTPNRVAAIAAVGVGEVTVTRRMRIAVISTGSELVPLGQPLEFGQIHDSNGPLLATLVIEAGAELVSQQCVADESDALHAVIESARERADVIVLTGGASVGAYDTTREVLDRNSSAASAVNSAPNEHTLTTVQFDKVAMQPGKPQGFGVLADGTYVFALPGNPVSVWVSWHVFVEPALRTLAGRVDVDPLWHAVPVAQGWHSPAGREQFMPIRLASAPGEELRVAPAGVRGSGSHLAASLAQATGIARVAAEVTEVRENEKVLMRGLY